MKFLLVIFLSLPCVSFSQTIYDKYTQNPKIDANTTKNTSQGAIIIKLVADTLAKSKRILALETTLKTMQSSIANLGSQISLLTTKFQDSVTKIKIVIKDSSNNLRKYVDTNSVILSPVNFNIINRVATIKK